MGCTYYNCVRVRSLQMAMIRSKVCMISECGHLRVAKSAGRKMPNQDQEAAYQDIVGEFRMVLQGTHLWLFLEQVH